MRVLVVGAAGQVGSYLKAYLADLNFEVVALCRKGLDIRDREEVFRQVSSFKPGVIINASAYTAVDVAESDSVTAYQVNRDGPAYLAEAANSVGAAIFHVSTDYVFSGEKTVPYVEEDECLPQSVYGASKLGGECAVRKACDRHIILRTAWVFGAEGGNFVKTMLRLGVGRTHLSVVGDQCGGPTFAGDIAKVLVQLVERLEQGKVMTWGVYHYSGYPYASWYEFACRIFRQAEVQALLPNPVKVNSISTEEYPTAAKRPANSCLDCSSILSVYDIKPSDWQLAIKDLSPFIDSGKSLTL